MDSRDCGPELAFSYSTKPTSFPILQPTVRATDGCTRTQNLTPITPITPNFTRDPQPEQRPPQGHIANPELYPKPTPKPWRPPSTLTGWKDQGGGVWRQKVAAATFWMATEWKGEHPFCTFVFYLHISLRSSWRTDSTKREEFDTFFAPLGRAPVFFSYTCVTKCSLARCSTTLPRGLVGLYRVTTPIMPDGHKRSCPGRAAPRSRSWRQPRDRGRPGSPRC